MRIRHTERKNIDRLFLRNQNCGLRNEGVSLRTVYDKKETRVGQKREKVEMR